MLLQLQILKQEEFQLTKPLDLRGLRGLNIIGADIVCFAPHLDTTRITALNASSILHEIVTIIPDRISKFNPKK
jgi:arginase family enzyme